VPRSVKKSIRHSKRSTLCFKNSKRVDKSLSTVIIHSHHHPLIIVITISIILTQPPPKKTQSPHIISHTLAHSTLYSFSVWFYSLPSSCTNSYSFDLLCISYRKYSLLPQFPPSPL
jgi:hypothetical protein